MKVAITGHTRGIGKSIYDYFSKDHIVQGFSRSNGYNISRPQDRINIINQSSDADIFVNNAYHNFDNSQLLMLKEVVSHWSTQQQKIIINVSSRHAGDFDVYAKTKLELDNFCKSLIYQENLYVLNLKPGLVDTQRVKNILGDRMPVGDVVSVIEFCLSNLKNFKITEIAFGK